MGSILRAAVGTFAMLLAACDGGAAIPRGGSRVAAVPDRSSAAPERNPGRAAPPPVVTPVEVQAFIDAWEAAEGAVASLRRIMEERDRPVHDAAVREMKAALTDLPLSDADLTMFLEGVEFEAHAEPQRIGPQLAMAGLARFGERAAPAVALVRILLARPLGSGAGDLMETDEYVWECKVFVAAAARLLIAIGPAARDAVPDLRIAAAAYGDESGVIRDAITKLSAR